MQYLTEDNFVLYAMKHYDNPQCYSTEEFYEDLNRFRYLKRLLGKYRETSELKTNLILNHIVVLYNMFGAEPTVRMLFLKCEDFLDILKPFLIFMNILPEVVYNINKKTIIKTTDIPLDSKIVTELRKIQNGRCN